MSSFLARFGRWLKHLSVLDWITLTYIIVVNLVLFGVEPGAQRSQQFAVMGAILVLFVGVLVVVRGRLLQHSAGLALVYRFSHMGVLFGSYLAYTDYLPLINKTTVDLQLFEFDMNVFGVEPAVAFDSLVSPALTEWFSFFYYGYFFVIAAHCFFVLLCVRAIRPLTEFTTAVALLYAAGQALYLLVPGYGPYHAIPRAFASELPTGFWWGLVQDIVRSGGAQMDIFPSLHTAAPMYVFLFSYANRDRRPFRFTWAPMGFAAINIMIATMYLRWHYVIDVIAGLALASVSFYVGRRVSRWEPSHRVRAELTPLWPALGWEHVPAEGTAEPVLVTPRSSRVARRVDAITEP